MYRIDFLALGIVCALLALAAWAFPHFALKKIKPHLFYSSLEPLQSRARTWREKGAKLPFMLFGTAMGLFLLALIDPHKLVESTTDETPQEGIALYLALDRSGSMGTVIDQVYENGAWRPVTRFDRLKEVVYQFIKKAPTDLLGVVTFARSTQVVSPLTLDHQAVIEAVRKLSVVKDKAQDGTAIGYAIYKTVHLIAATKAFQESLPKDKLPPYLIRSAVLIVITDGFQDPSALDRGNPLRTMELEEASAYAKEKGVRVYIVNIDSKLNEEQYAPNRHQMEHITEATGGKFIFANDLPSTLEQIDQLEKSRIYHEEPFFKRISFFPYLIGFSLLLLGIGFACKNTIWRQTV